MSPPGPGASSWTRSWRKRKIRLIREQQIKARLAHRQQQREFERPAGWLRRTKRQSQSAIAS